MRGGFSGIEQMDGLCDDTDGRLDDVVDDLLGTREIGDTGEVGEISDREDLDGALDETGLKSSNSRLSNTLKVSSASSIKEVLSPGGNCSRGTVCWTLVSRSFSSTATGI